MYKDFFKELYTIKSDKDVETITQSNKYQYIQSLRKNKDVFAIHMCFFELPIKKVLRILADCSFNLNPNVDTLVKIVLQTVKIYKIFSCDIPKVAILSANEKISPKVFSTNLAYETKQALSDYKNIIVEGPISFDLAISKESANIKKYSGNIQGDANIFIAPRADTANSLMQSIRYIIKEPVAEVFITNNKAIAIIEKNNNFCQNRESSIIIAQEIERKLDNV